MPFKSEKQRRYLFANHPKIARKWTRRYGSGKAGSKPRSGKAGSRKSRSRSRARSPRRKRRSRFATSGRPKAKKRRSPRRK